MPSTRDAHASVPVRILLDTVVLDGDLVVPPLAEGIVLFAHGSGSGRYSPRNRRVAHDLNAAGFATLLLDLLTASEERWDATTAALRFDIPFLARRLVAATDWIAANPKTSDLAIGYFGASTGAAAALIAAVDRPIVRAVVSRGGRPDLATPVLSRVKAPTLLIVGGDDTQVIDLNRQALGHLRCVKALEIVPHATHLFEEPGALEQVTNFARDWYRRYLTAASPPGVAG